MALTYTAIATTTVGSGGAANIEFTSIPATYTDLLVKLSTRTNNTGDGNGTKISFNGSTSDLSSRYLYGTGSTAGSGSSATDGFIAIVNGTTETSNTFSNTDIYIPNYAGSNNKSAASDSVMENNATGAYQVFYAVLWSNAAAITSVTLTPGLGSWVQYSTATLYGIKATV